MMDYQCTKMLRELQALEFALVELNLYLDTHPRDDMALQSFNDLAKRLAEAKKAYETRYGPLINFGNSGHVQMRSWQWVEEPWPWEIEY
jgi:spore coat protein JB